MKIYFTVLLLVIASITNAQQNSIEGKWKPAYFSLGDLVTGDLSKDVPDMNLSLDSLVKNDKDPEASKEMMIMICQLMFDKTKALMEEYKANGEFIETDLKRGRIKSGTYIFDEQKSELIKTYIDSPKQYVFKIEVSNKSLILKSALKAVGEKEAEYIVTYKKL